MLHVGLRQISMYLKSPFLAIILNQMGVDSDEFLGRRIHSL